jgi:hypothetical protein
MRRKKKIKKFIPLVIAIYLLLSFFGGETEEPIDDSVHADVGTPVSESIIEDDSVNPNSNDVNLLPIDEGTYDYDYGDTDNEQIFEGYRVIFVDGGNLSGHREPNVAVDIGYGNREYWAFTNQYGQLVKVTAQEIILQDDDTEPVTSSGRYYYDEAKVPGTELSNYDEGHVIADSLGGVSNAYNITPQESTLNRHGDQAYMESTIRNAGGCTDFVAIITYPNTSTQTPSHYEYTYKINGNTIKDSFDNVNPDEVNKPIIESQVAPTETSTTTPNLASVDTNGNGKVTIAEAKAAGYKMPITRDHWLYQYMDDRDGDGKVGE